MPLLDLSLSALVSSSEIFEDIHVALSESILPVERIRSTPAYRGVDYSLPPAIEPLSTSGTLSLQAWTGILADFFSQ